MPFLTETTNVHHDNHPRKPRHDEISKILMAQHKSCKLQSDKASNPLGHDRHGGAQKAMRVEPIYLGDKKPSGSCSKALL